MGPESIVAVLAGLGGVGAWAAYRKSGPEAESITVGTLRGVIEELRTEVNRLSAEVEELRKENQELRRIVRDQRRNR